MNSPQLNSSQMEFGFVETATGKRPPKGRARKSAAKLRAEKLAQTINAPGEEPLKSALSVPFGDTKKAITGFNWNNAPGVFGLEWIKGARENIRNARDLREAVALSACYLTDLMDHDIDLRGHNEAWKQEYEAYCWTHYFSLAIETEPELEKLRPMWWMAGVILYTYNNANDLSDWELYEELCSFEVDATDLDGNGAEASFMEFLASFLSKAHDLLFRAGGRISIERD